MLNEIALSLAFLAHVFLYVFLAYRSRSSSVGWKWPWLCMAPAMYIGLSVFGAVSGYSLEIHQYVGHNYFTSPLVNLDYTILDGAPADRPLPPFLDQRGVNLFYVDESLWQKLSANPTHRAFLTSPESAGWKILAGQDTEAGRWMLLQER